MIPRPSYTGPLHRAARQQAMARLAQHAALAAAVAVLALGLAHTALGAATRLTQDLITAEAVRGW